MDNSDGIICSVGLRLNGAKQRFGKRVVVAHPWPGEGKGDTQLRHFTGQGERSHWGTIVGVKIGDDSIHPSPCTDSKIDPLLAQAKE